jgi:hypothetical protein
VRTGDRAWLRVAVLFSALTIVATWPQVIQPAGIPDHRDAWLNMWRLAWVAHQVPRDPMHLFDANIHHPEPGTLAYSDATLVQGLLASPLLRAAVPAPYVHTGLVLASFVFAGVSAWALVRRLTGSSLAGIASGMIFAFTPYRFDHYMHLELLWTGWMPLTLLALHRAIERGSGRDRGRRLGSSGVRDGGAVGLLFAAQALSCIYYGVFFGTVLVAFTAVLLAGRPWAETRRATAALMCGAAIAGALLFAYLMPYRTARVAVGERTAGEARLYSAGPVHYLAATPQNLLYGSFADQLGRPEKRLFPGLVALALAGVAIWPPITRKRLAYLIALLLAVDLSFGPSGITYDWLREYVFPYRGLRAPARAGGIVMLMIAVLAGYGWARLERSGRGFARATAWPMAIVLLAAIMFEYVAIPQSLIAAPTDPEPAYIWLAGRQDDGAVIELPMPDEHALPGHDAEFTYQSTFHWLPIVNGYSGNVPQSYVDMLRAIRSFPSDDAIGLLHRLGVTYIVVHERFYGPALYKEVVDALDRRSDVVKQQSFGQSGEEVTVYSPAGAVHD